MTTLLHCPFCGGEGAVRRPLGGLHNFEVRCLSCDAATAVTHEDYPNECILLWNNRKGQEYLEKTLLKIQTHQGLDANNYRMRAYDVLCECQKWAEEALARKVTGEPT